jgi:transposase
MWDEEQLQERYAAIWPVLDEKQRRMVAAADAKALGRGGIATVARASGLSRPTLYQGLQDLTVGPGAAGRIRRVGAGRKRKRDHEPGLVRQLETLVAPETRGDPMSPLRWTCKSTRQLASALSQQGFVVSYRTVGTLLHELGYSLQANAKTLEGSQHPDRDAQFRYINAQVKRYLRKKLPVISVDTKKKELVGQYKNGGREWQRSGQPEQVNVHDFPDPSLGKAIPYGIYDLGQDSGWVNVGCDHDTARFAVESMRGWWRGLGRRRYPKARQLLICADAGGSNSYRTRLWKVELQRFATATGLAITVCHFPPGTSKWNKIEHRLFSYISMNWRGRPLISHEVVVNLIGATTTRRGLKVKARFDPKPYPTEEKVSDTEMARLLLVPHPFHGEWNYTLKPTPNTEYSHH